MYSLLEEQPDLTYISVCPLGCWIICTYLQKNNCRSIGVGFKIEGSWDVFTFIQ